VAHWCTRNHDKAHPDRSGTHAHFTLHALIARTRLVWPNGATDNGPKGPPVGADMSLAGCLSARTGTAQGLSRDRGAVQRARSAPCGRSDTSSEWVLAVPKRPATLWRQVASYAISGHTRQATWLTAKERIADTRLGAREQAATLVSGPTESASPILVVARKLQSVGMLTDDRCPPHPPDD
jgi:hypothetical protein